MTRADRASTPDNVGVYVIEHLPTGRVYVGASRQLRHRWIGHRQSLARGTNTCRWLQMDWIRDGAEAFEFRVIESGFTNLRQLAHAEEAAIARYAGRLYNVRTKVAHLDQPYGPWSRMATVPRAAVQPRPARPAPEDA